MVSWNRLCPYHFSIVFGAAMKYCLNVELKRCWLNLEFSLIIFRGNEP